MYKLAVVGSRNFTWRPTIYAILEKVFIIKGPFILVSGGCKGPDKIAEDWAKSRNIETQIFHPDWDQHGRAAGPIRNKLIVEESDFVFAFWDGKSKGTLSSINYCKSLSTGYKVILQK
jgi:hypothetical protein